MRLLSVNVSYPMEVVHRRKTVSTGIFKEPVSGRVMLREFNLDGDGQADLVNHGGLHRAVYAYTVEHYDYWGRDLVRDDLSFGQFGENFTVEGMTEDDVHIGDVFRVGDALVEVSQPRPPCFKLGIKMGMSHFPKLFLASGRVGFYLRVLEEGEVGAGDGIERVRQRSRKIDGARDEPPALLRSRGPGWRQAGAARARALAWVARVVREASCRGGRGARTTETQRGVGLNEEVFFSFIAIPGEGYRALRHARELRAGGERNWLDGPQHPARETHERQEILDEAVARFPGKKDSIHLAQLPKPKVGDVPDGRGVLVEVLRVGVDGTDKEINDAEYGASPEGHDFLVTGHESFGRVLEVGPNVGEIEVGDHIVATVRRPGSSVYDRIGLSDVTTDETYRERGINLLHGYLTEIYVDDADFIVRVPAALKEVGVLLEPTSIVEKGIEQTYTRSNAASRSGAHTAPPSSGPGPSGSWRHLRSGCAAST